MVMLHTLSRPVNQEKEDLPYALLTGEPLRCPSCGGEYLHHGCVSVFDTLEDNSERFRKTRLTSVHGDDISHRIVTTDQNPSARRDGVAIEFWCENCLHISEFTLAQHKGQSYAVLRPTIRRKPLHGSY
ncbi:MAG TPA: hypothetical protein VGP42_13540 [Stellaceae bacterium]|nr:hypothetical protein [Stellaceae bacterium]